MEILFVTSNPKKIVSPARALSRYGIEVGHVNPEPEIVEIQAETPEKVAAAKAEEAYRRVGRPLFALDSAFFIQALGNFPGVFMKQVTRQIGAAGYLKLIRPDDGGERYPRQCVLVDAIAYLDETIGTPKIFVRRIHGTLATEVWGRESSRYKSDIFRIFIPEGESKPLAAMSESEYALHRERVEGFYHEFGSWLASPR